MSDFYERTWGALVAVDGLFPGAPSLNKWREKKRPTPLTTNDAIDFLGLLYKLSQTRCLRQKVCFETVPVQDLFLETVWEVVLKQSRLLTGPAGLQLYRWVSPILASLCYRAPSLGLCPEYY